MDLGRAVRTAEDIVIMDYSTSAWVELFLECHRIKVEDQGKKKVETTLLAWPDGESMLDQYNLTVEVFKALRFALRESM